MRRNSTTASIASAVGAFNLLSFPLGLGDAANASGVKIVVFCLHALYAAKIFEARLLPFGNEGTVGYLLLNTVVVQFSTDRLPSKHIVDVSANLVVYPKNRPKGLGLSFSFVWLCLG